MVLLGMRVMAMAVAMMLVVAMVLAMVLAVVMVMVKTTTMTIQWLIHSANERGVKTNLKLMVVTDLPMMTEN